MQHPERITGGTEHSGEISKEAARRSAELQPTHERENPGERAERTERARVEAMEHAEAIAGPERAPAETEHRNADSEAPTASKAKRKASFKRTMKHVQDEMPLPQRTFSKMIHTPVIERTSEVMGNTIARPHAIASGAGFAFAAVLALYLTARYMGFSLSGFETIGAFIVGWLLGIIFDLLRVLVRGKS